MGQYVVYVDTKELGKPLSEQTFYDSRTGAIIEIFADAAGFIMFKIFQSNLGVMVAAIDCPSLFR